MRGTTPHCGGKFIAQATYRKRLVHIGVFATRREAAVAYDTFQRLAGRAANVNFPLEELGEAERALLRERGVVDDPAELVRCIKAHFKTRSYLPRRALPGGIERRRGGKFWLPELDGDLGIGPAVVLELGDALPQERAAAVRKAMLRSRKLFASLEDARAVLEAARRVRARST